MINVNQPFNLLLQNSYCMIIRYHLSVHYNMFTPAISVEGLYVPGAVGGQGEGEL